LYAGLNILMLVIDTLKNYVTYLYQMETSYSFSVKMIEKSEELSLKDFENDEIYNMLKRAQSESINKPFSLFQNVIYLIGQIIQLISVGAIIYIWNPKIILIIMVLPILTTIYTAWIGYIKYKIEMMRTDKTRKISYINYLMTNDIAYKEIKIYNLKDYFVNSFKTLYKFIIKLDREVLRKQATTITFLELIDEGIGVWIIYTVTMSAAIGEILIGDTIAYINSFSHIQKSLKGILNSIISIYQENLYIEQLFALLEYNNTESEPNRKIIIDTIETIEIKNLDYKYSTRAENALNSINLSINKGELISLVGKNGSGKTTLVKILAGFIQIIMEKYLLMGLTLER